MARVSTYTTWMKAVEYLTRAPIPADAVHEEGGQTWYRVFRICYVRPQEDGQGRARDYYYRRTELVGITTKPFLVSRGTFDPEPPFKCISPEGYDPHVGLWVTEDGQCAQNLQEVKMLCGLASASEFVQEAARLYPQYRGQLGRCVEYSFRNWVTTRVAGILTLDTMALFFKGGCKSPFLTPVPAIADAVPIARPSISSYHLGVSSSRSPKWMDAVVEDVAEGVIGSVRRAGKFERLDFDPVAAIAGIGGNLLDHLAVDADIKAGRLLKLVAEKAGLKPTAEGYTKKEGGHSILIGNDGRVYIDGHAVCVVSQGDVPLDDRMAAMIVRLQSKDRMSAITTLQPWRDAMEVIFPLDNSVVFDSTAFAKLEEFDGRDPSVIENLPESHPTNN